MDRKGMIEVQFNWIFVIIAGAAILAFFIGAANYYINHENDKLARKVLTDIQKMLAEAQQSKRTVQSVNLPSYDLIVRCSDDCSSYGCPSTISFEGTTSSIATDMDIVFAEETIKSDVIYAWTQEWKVPYKVTNFLYLIVPGTTVYLVYDDTDEASRTLAKDLFTVMNENDYLEHKMIEKNELTSVEYKGEAAIKLVFLYNPDAVTLSESLVDSEKVEVLQVQGDKNSGQLQFHELAGNSINPGNIFDYLGTTSILGAIFSENSEHYSGNMKKAYLRLRTVTMVYKYRSEELIANSATNCQSAYTQALKHFSTIVAAAESQDAVTIAAQMNGLSSANHATLLGTCQQRIY